jgi:hypothetical protein
MATTAAKRFSDPCEVWRFFEPVVLIFCSRMTKEFKEL